MLSNSEDLLGFADHILQLSDLPRTGWLFCGVQNPESVADHSFGVVAISMWLADVLQEGLGSVIRMAVLHDVGESVVTDIPGPVKTKLGPGVRTAEALIARGIAGAAHDSWAAVVSEYGEQESRASKIVKAADHIQMILQAKRYSRFGNGDVTQFLALEVPIFGDDELDKLVGEILR